VVKASASHGWNGVPARSTDLRTFDLELPRGEATVKCGKFFEVRYFLNIGAGARLVTVQLPVVLVHMNSLDVVPNSVAQVAAAIEEKRARARMLVRGRPAAVPAGVARLPGGRRSSPPRRRGGSADASLGAGVQGRAFAAPRKQSRDRVRAEGEELAAVGRILGSSPRKHVAGPIAAAPPPVPPLAVGGVPPQTNDQQQGIQKQLQRVPVRGKVPPPRPPPPPALSSPSPLPGGGFPPAAAATDERRAPRVPPPPPPPPPLLPPLPPLPPARFALLERAMKAGLGLGLGLVGGGEAVPEAGTEAPVKQPGGAGPVFRRMRSFERWRGNWI
jgi:hypothetical protein